MKIWTYWFGDLSPSVFLKQDKKTTPHGIQNQNRVLLKLTAFYFV